MISATISVLLFTNAEDNRQMKDTQRGRKVGMDIPRLEVVAERENNNERLDTISCYLRRRCRGAGRDPRAAFQPERLRDNCDRHNMSNKYKWMDIPIHEA